MSVARAEGCALPLAPLLAAFRAERRSPATPVVLDARLLDFADVASFTESLVVFYREAAPHGWHEGSLRRSASLLRYSLAHLLRGADPLPTRLERCLLPSGPYFVGGLGQTFWSAVVQSLSPTTLPRWLPAVEAGVRRVGRIAARTSVGSIAAFAEVCEVYSQVLKTAPDLTAADLDELFARTAAMTGRELPPAEPNTTTRIESALREVRAALPLRKRLKEHVQASPLTPTAWLALRQLDEAFPEGLESQDEKALIEEAVTHLRERHHVHSLEVGDLLERIAAKAAESQTTLSRAFGGFCADSFQFLRELADNNRREWMETHRDRYQFAVRQPMTELCNALAERYVRPILANEYGWQIECEPRTGKALTSIVKNDYGQTTPYVPEMWLTFYSKAGTVRRNDAQLFVKLDATGVTFGFHLGRTARDAGKRLRTTIQQHAAQLFDALAATNATAFAFGDSPLKSTEDLRAWATAKTLTACQQLPADAALLRSDDFVGEVLLAFDRLLPLFAAAVDENPLQILRKRAGRPETQPVFDAESFQTATLLPDVWLDRVRGLLKAKKQLILRGVSGTGKTHVAKALARLLTRDRAEAVRFVQFHPAYTYEEFVERPQGDGFHDGVLLGCAAEANRRPAETFVLLIDELTRANLPRVFGELLYLLEYRGEAVTLPYSKRTFRLPANLLILATANLTDPSADTLDQPLRRRFAFVDMPPDAALLARWFAANPPADPDPAFGPRALKLFEQLNARLARDCGKEWQLGHTLFMVPDLTRDKLATVWRHHVTPLLDARRTSADLLASFDLDRWFGPEKKLVAPPEADAPPF